MLPAIPWTKLLGSVLGAFGVVAAVLAVLAGARRAGRDAARAEQAAAGLAAERERKVRDNEVRRLDSAALDERLRRWQQPGT